jgi:glycerol-3-phosphate dehydrogenase (NAD(P)+)
MNHSRLHARARHRGVDPVVYRLSRAVLEPFFVFYFRLSRIGRAHIPAVGPVIVAANHRSFLDPFVIGTLARRPLHYMAKEELFRHPLVAWWLSALGAFPVRRGSADAEAMATAQAILARGGVVLVFPEGTRVRPGPLGTPRRGVGHLALETGAPVVPVAIIGTEAVRDGWRLRPHKVRVRAGRPIAVPRTSAPDAASATALTERIWSSVRLQWEWLGGLPSLRRAAVIGAGEAATALADALGRAQLEVDLAAPGAEALELSRHDLVALVPGPAGLAGLLDRHAERIPPRATVLVAAPDAAPASAALAAERTRAHVAGALRLGPEPRQALGRGGAVGLAAHDPVLARAVRRILARAGVRANAPADGRPAGRPDAALTAAQAA